MRKEFEAPVIEVRSLTPCDSVMFGVMLTSAGQNPDGFAQMDDEAVAGYNVWKGLGK